MGFIILNGVSFYCLRYYYNILVLNIGTYWDSICGRFDDDLMT